MEVCIPASHCGPLGKHTFCQASMHSNITLSAVISVGPEDCVSQKKLAWKCEIRYCTACMFTPVRLYVCLYACVCVASLRGALSVTMRFVFLSS